VIAVRAERDRDSFHNASPPSVSMWGQTIDCRLS
jgi:hypothetical protein